MKTKSKIVSFKTTKQESALITRIVERAMKLAARHGVDYLHSTCRMDITACHANGSPLDLEKLLTFPDFDFAHDVFGIARHIDRETGELMDFFSPRCSL